MSTEIRKRKVLSRDHDHIAEYISSEKKRREGTEWRQKHEPIWEEVDRQISMEAPEVSQDPEDKGDWHNVIQLGDLTDASETITADALRMIMPAERKHFIPHVKVGEGHIEGDPIHPKVQRSINSVIRNFMIQQQQDFGLRSRIKLAIKEILHHGSVVCVMSNQHMFKYEGGSIPRHLVAPAPTIYSMWNCYPDPSPSVCGTELFYTGSMIIEEWIKLQDALQTPNWINRDKLQEYHGKKDLNEHISILHHYGDIFLKRYDGNILFPNRHTVVSGGVFLESTVNPTPYSPVIYVGYERDDVRDPYFTSPIVKRAPMGKFATHMANRTMDAVDMNVEPPVQYDSHDNSMRGEGPRLYPGSKIPTRGGTSVEVLEIGDPGIGLAALQWAKQEMQEGTTVDAVRKGVSPGTEQTATEVVKTEQRAEVREVEFAAVLEDHLLLPILTMQHEINKKEMTTYEFYNDEPHTPDHMMIKRKDLPKTIIFEVTGSRAVLGEQERQNRFMGTVNLASQNQFLAQATDWQEVARQMWEDSKQKDPERFIKDEEGENAQVQQMQAQFQEQMQDFQEQIKQLQDEGKQLEGQVQKLTTDNQKLQIEKEQDQLKIDQLHTKNVVQGEQMKLAQAKQRLQDDEHNMEMLMEREKTERAKEDAKRKAEEAKAKDGEMQEVSREIQTDDSGKITAINTKSKRA